jgi:hypothetical protein
MTTTTTTTTTTDTEFNARIHPLRTLADVPERWHALDRGRRGGQDREPLTFEQAYRLVEAAAAEDGAREDVASGALDRLAVDVDPRTGILHVVRTQQVGSGLAPVGQPMPLRRSALSDLCQRAHAPADYLSRLPATLARACLQHGLVSGTGDRTGTMRLARGEVRAIVGERYAACDDLTVLDAMGETLYQQGLLADVRVRAVGTGTRLTLRVTVPTGAEIIRPGDVSEWGIDLGNGELGNASVSVTPISYRLVCANGMRGWSQGDRRAIRHVGDPSRVQAYLSDALPAAITAARGIPDALRAATARMVDDVAAEFDLLRSPRYGLAQSEVAGVARSLFADRGLTLPASTTDAAWTEALRETRGISSYDVIQGITEYAQGRPVERRLDLEAAAGQYLAQRTGRA